MIFMIIIFVTNIIQLFYMAQRKQYKSALAICLAAFLGVITACVNEKDLYDPEFNKNALPSGKKEFGFSTRGDVKLSVDYGAPGFKTLIEVYDEEPIVGSSYKVKEGLEPIYSAYTDGNGKFEGTMNIPTMTKTVYLYTCLIGLPQCVKLEATAAGFTYDATKTTQTRAVATRAGVNTGTFPYKLLPDNRTDNVYSIVQWDVNGVPSGEYVSKVTSIGSEALGTISKRVTDFLQYNAFEKPNAEGNKDLLRNPNQINIKSPSEGMEISVTAVGSKGAYYNSFGYYYYKTSEGMNPNSFYGMKKYIIFPNTEKPFFSTGTTVKLVYFDEAGKPQTRFPAGYTVGWFLISDGFRQTAPNVAKLDDFAYNGSANNIKYRNACISNDVESYRQFITVYDEKSKLRVIGTEDMLYPKAIGDDYMDLTFFVSTTPDLGNEDDLEEVPQPKPEGGTLSQSGTLAFEDNWPDKGDYDLNDVAVEYKREVTYNGDNKATGLVETFKFIQRDLAAVFNDYFAYQVDNMGTITASEGCTIEKETNSIIINGTSKVNKEKTFTIKRTLNGDIDKDVVLKDFNPYIIINELGRNRTEVHLPNTKSTSYADQSKLFSGVDSWFMYIDGKYPFAINIPVAGFNLSAEKVAIDKSYPKFRTWADSNGTTDEDWYK